MVPLYFQVFSLEEERALADYVIKCSKMFHGLSIKSTRKLAWEYAKQNLKDYPDVWDKNREAGMDWYYGLMKRNSNLSLRMPEATSIARATAFNRYNVDMFFNHYNSIINRPNFQLEPRLIWNLDETGVNTVQGTSKILSEKGLKQVGQITSAERGVLITMCCCVSAVGATLPPAYIFPRVNFGDHMLNGAPNGSLGLATPSGWMNCELFVVVLKHFIKHMNVSKNNPAILVMDNHESHVTLQTIDTARENGLIILSFPPHCSHRMQPLDVSIYGPFKRYFNTACNDWMMTNPGRALTIYDIGTLSGQAYDRAFIPANVTAGFKRTGIYPVNRNVFTDDLFLPSVPTDREEVPVRHDMQEECVGEEAHEEEIEPNVAPVPRYAGAPQPSTSTAASTPKSPEDIRPYPRAAPRKKGMRRSNAKKSAILTDTPERERAVLAAERKKKLGPVKRALNIAIVEAEPEEVTEDAELTPNPEEAIQFQDKEPEPGDYVLVEYAGKDKKRHYIGLITQPKDGEDDFEVKFLRKSAKHVLSCCFVEPYTQEIVSVEASSILGVLSQPTSTNTTKRRRGIMQFDVNLNGYNMH